MAQRSADRRFHPALSSLPDEDFRADLPETPKTPQKSPQTRGPPAGVSANCEKKNNPHGRSAREAFIHTATAPFLITASLGVSLFKCTKLSCTIKAHVLHMAHYTSLLVVSRSNSWIYCFCENQRSWSPPPPLTGGWLFDGIKSHNPARLTPGRPAHPSADTRVLSALYNEVHRVITQKWGGNK